MIQKAPTLRDVARAAGCSRTTVSLALREPSRIRTETRERVLKEVHKIGYRRNLLLSHVMAQLRKTNSTSFRGKLALLNLSPGEGGNAQQPFLGECVAGCESHARLLGYDFDRFFLHEPKISVTRLLSILRTRAIKGVVLVGAADLERLPDALLALVGEYPVVVAGGRIQTPPLPCVVPDYYRLVFETVDRVLAAGYRRPGLVVSSRLDAASGYRLTAGYVTALTRAQVAPVAPAYDGDMMQTDQGGSLRDWLKRHDFDVILTGAHHAVPSLQQAGWSARAVPAVVSLDLPAGAATVPGMSQNGAVIGHAAVDLLIQQMDKGRPGGANPPPRVLVEPVWASGAPALPRAPGTGRT